MYEKRGQPTIRMRHTAVRALVLVALCAAVAIWGAGTALPQTGSRQTASVKFVEKRPGVPTALTFSADYVNPDNPSGKPPAVRPVVKTLAS